MPRRASHDRQIRTVADSQLGLVTAAQLGEIGVSPGTVAHRLRPGGMWSRVLPGVHLVTGGLPDRAQRDLAALLYVGEPAVLTGLTALRRHGFRSMRLQEVPDDRRAPEAVHVLIPHERRRVSTSYVRIERTTRYPSAEGVVLRDGLLCAASHRALADAARRLRDLDDVVALATEAVRRGSTTLDHLADEVTEGSRRGHRHLRDAVELIRHGVWSAPEGTLLLVCREAALPEPVLNCVLLTSSGRFIARPDAWLDDVGLAVEVDSQAHHADGRDWERTLTRQVAYATAGVAVLPITPRQLRDDRAGVVAALREAYDAAAARPRPPVRIVADAIAWDRTSQPARWAG